MGSNTRDVQPTNGMKAVIEEAQKAALNGEKNVSTGELMRRAGYSESYAANPQYLTRSQGWKAALEQIDDQEIVQNVQEIAKEKEDKRSALQAADMIFKLKDRYPANKLKVASYNEHISHLIEEPGDAEGDN